MDRFSRDRKDRPAYANQDDWDESYAIANLLGKDCEDERSTDEVHNQPKAPEVVPVPEKVGSDIIPRDGGETK